VLTKNEVKELKNFATKIRIETMRTIESIGVGHTGGSLSIAEVLSVLYGKVMNVDPKNPQWEDRDWMVMSKGHAGPALYSTLGLKGYFPMEDLLTLNRPGTNFPSHCDWTKTKGIDMTTGSLGQGTSSAMGIALGLKMNGKKSNVFLLVGDGESQEGQVWEAALFAAHWKLDNVIAFVDYNKQQIDGRVSEVNDIGDIEDKYRAFGWHAQSVDGHDVEAIYNAIEKAKEATGRPSMIVLNTIKGKGYSALEGTPSNHNSSVSKEQLEEAIKEFEAQFV
jgi:transketolase